MIHVVPVASEERHLSLQSSRPCSRRQVAQDFRVRPEVVRRIVAEDEHVGCIAGRHPVIEKL